MIGLLLCSDSTATPKNHEFIALARQFQIHKKWNQTEEQEKRKETPKVPLRHSTESFNWSTTLKKTLFHVTQFHCPCSLWKAVKTRRVTLTWERSQNIHPSVFISLNCPPYFGIVKIQDYKPQNIVLWIRAIPHFRSARKVIKDTTLCGALSQRISIFARM